MGAGIGSDHARRRLRRGDSAVTERQRRLGGGRGLLYVGFDRHRPKLPWTSASSARSRSSTRAARSRSAGSKQRALLALLLLHANETLSTDRLIDELWGERPPASAAKTVQVHVSRLRKALAAEAGKTGAAWWSRASAATSCGSIPSGSTRTASSGCGRGPQRAGRRPPRAGGRGARAGALAVARPAARRPGLRAVRPARDRASRGPARGRARAADRGQARARPPRRGDRRSSSR